MAITEEAKTAHRERVAALRERFGEPNTAFDQAVREAFNAYCDDEITIGDLAIVRQEFDPSYPKLLDPALLNQNHHDQKGDNDEFSG